MGLDTNALITLADLKAYLGTVPADADALLEILINQASGMVQTYLGRTLIAPATAVEILLDGEGQEFLMLPNWPVTTLTSVYEDSALLVIGSDQDFVSYAERGILRRVGAKWSEGVQNIKITYIAGYALAAIPRDIQALVMNKCAKEWQKQKESAWGQTSRNMASGSMNFEFDLAFTKDEEKVLAPHMRMTP